MQAILALEDGEDELAEFLIDRIQAHGGECQLDQRATQLVIRRGAVAGRVAGGGERPPGPRPAFRSPWPRL